MYFLGEKFHGFPCPLKSLGIVLSHLAISFFFLLPLQIGSEAPLLPLNSLGVCVVSTLSQQTGWSGLLSCHHPHNLLWGLPSCAVHSWAAWPVTQTPFLLSLYRCTPAIFKAQVEDWWGLEEPIRVMRNVEHVQRDLTSNLGPALWGWKVILTFLNWLPWFLLMSARYISLVLKLWKLKHTWFL